MNRKRRNVRNDSLVGILLLFIAANVILWPVDALCRLFKKPDASAVYWSDELVLEKPADDTANTEEAPTVQDTSENTGNSLGVPVQDAAFGSEPKSDMPDGFVGIPKDESHVHSGILVQIDQTHPYTGNAGELTTFAEKNETYRMKRMDLSTRPEVLAAMNSMGSAYMGVSGVANLMVYSTVKPYDVAGSLYPTALPDRSSGYCLDLCLLNEDGTISKFSEPNAWVKENCWKYGFVFSYPETDTGVTGVEYAPYHLRYVGQVHSGLMHENNLTLSAYYTYLKEHTYDVPLYQTVGDTMYMVYYVQADEDGTEVPVPRDKEYDISGNNSDGFIVTVKI